MEYSRDTVVIEHIKVAWTEGKVAGFVPWSYFVRDESANRKEEKICFYQTFGFEPAAWRSMDEHPFPEATPADFYDARNRCGRWDYLQYVEPVVAPEVAVAAAAASGGFEHQNVWEKWLKGDDNPEPEKMNEAVKGMLIAAGLEILPPEVEEKLHLVPEWESFISYEKHLQKVDEEWEETQRAYIAARAVKKCPACAAGEKLYGDGYRFFHRKDFAFTKCASSSDHEFLETPAIEAYSAKSKSHYRVLRGDINKYSRTRSSRKRLRSHEAFKKLVEMGREAIPFILHDLKKGRVGGLWSAEVLAELTGQRGGADPEWWLAWAKSEKYSLELET